MPTHIDMRNTLHSIDGRGYKAYKEIRGTYLFTHTESPECTLYIDYVQGDPFAAPSRVRMGVRKAWPNSPRGHSPTPAVASVWRITWPRHLLRSAVTHRSVAALARAA